MDVLLTAYKANHHVFELALCRPIHNPRTAVIAASITNQVTRNAKHSRVKLWNL
jgi:hypothetical protein